MSLNSLSIGGVALNPQMVWSDRYLSQRVAQTAVTTLGGVPVVFSQALVAGESITLVAEPDRGWLTGAQVAAVAELAGQAGAVFELEVNGVVRQVVFRHHEAPAFEARPLLARLNQQPTDYFTATIKLMTI